MHINDYYHQVLMPANVAVSAIRRMGIPVSVERIQHQRQEWTKHLFSLKQYVEGEAAKRGFDLRYSAANSVSPEILGRFLFSEQGLGLTPGKETPTGQPSTADESLAEYASLSQPRDGDNEVVRAVLKIRSLAKGIGTYLDAFERTRRADGCSHPRYKWNIRTPRLAAEDPPVHQIPERADKEVADGVKACLVARVKPARTHEEWDPRKHGSCFSWDIAGAEAAVRAAMLTAKFNERPDPVAYEYLRLGKDIHSKTASLIYGVPEGTYKKGSYQRDAVGKQTFFAKLFGAHWWTVQRTVWEKARVRLTDDEAQAISDKFDAGYPGLLELLERDKDHLGRFGYCQDGYGRRRGLRLTPELAREVRYVGLRHGQTYWRIRGREVAHEDELPKDDKKARWVWRNLERYFHQAANTPTQGMSATDTLWMLALCYHGEYVELRKPAMWVDQGLDYPEAEGWQFHEGPGPGGKPFLAWHHNTVHDSGWGDCAPGYLEPVAKLLWRRCRAVPFDWRLETDVPYRIELSVGPDHAHLKAYNAVAKQFGLEPLPE